jgi:hypothetical protein
MSLPKDPALRLRCWSCTRIIDARKTDTYGHTTDGLPIHHVCARRLFDEGNTARTAPPKGRRADGEL